MAKGQKRSTRETRKPKQEKSVAPKAEVAFGNQVRLAANVNAPSAKGRG